MWIEYFGPISISWEEIFILIDTVDLDMLPFDEIKISSDINWKLYYVVFCLFIKDLSPKNANLSKFCPGIGLQYIKL